MLADLISANFFLITNMQKNIENGIDKFFIYLDRFHKKKLIILSLRNFLKVLLYFFPLRMK
tara:strand:- start:483 stop:665 length:183 start_codon:yes stop_codon:yes gene_type:complete